MPLIGRLVILPQWMEEMPSYVSLDLIYYMIKGTLCNFHKVWMPYTEYCTTKGVCIENMPTSMEMPI